MTNGATEAVTTTQSNTAGPGRQELKGGKDLNFDIAGWYSPEISAEEEQDLLGTIVSAVLIKDRRKQDRIIYIVQLAAPLIVAQKGGDQTELAPGEIVGVTERAKLMCLRSCVEHNCKVLIRALDKIDIGGNDMWRFKVQAVGTKGKPISPESLGAMASGDEGKEGDDIPF